MGIPQSQRYILAVTTELLGGKYLAVGGSEMVAPSLDNRIHPCLPTLNVVIMTLQLKVFQGTHIGLLYE